MTALRLAAVALVLVSQASSMFPVAQDLNPAPVASAAPASVRVEHELIPIVAEAGPAPVATTPRDVTRARRRAAEPTLGEKARRALLGDGRHRPEPFPRVR